MDFELPPDDDPRRLAVREWLAAHPSPTGRQLAEAGYVAPHWPRPWGLDADPIHQLLIDAELTAAGVRRPVNPIGIGWAGPTILYGGSREQQERYLFPMLSGEAFWCQLFSEPGSGSDLANLGTRAVRDGEEFVVNGQKIWTSGAHYARFGILLARTDPELPKHKGISYFICPMDAAGIEIRPITEITGGHTFNEVFFTDARIPAENLVGDLNDGWRLAKVTLGNERISLSSGGVLWGNGPTALDMLASVKAEGPVTDAVLRRRLVDVYIEHQLLELMRMRTLTARLKGEQPGPEASVRKILADEHGQHVMNVARDVLGAGAMLTGDANGFVPGTETANLGPAKPRGALDHPGWYDGFIFSQALTIGGGTGEVQRNIVAERVLGLPHDVDVQQGLSWSAAAAPFMSDLVATAEALYDVLADGAEEAERMRRLPSATVAALVDAGLMQLCLPAVYGGPEADPLTMISVVEALARADGAAGWCAMIAGTTASQTLFTHPEAAQEIYSGPEIVGAGVFAPNGTGRVDGDTITVSGRWQWGSGSQHSHWILAGTMCDDEKFRLCWFDARDVGFHDTWHSSGLRGTGSLDFFVTDLAVPKSHTFEPFVTRPTVDSPLGAFPNFSMLAVGVAATGLGVARRALDEIVALAEGKVPMMSSRTLAESSHTAIELARAEIALRSARAFLHDEVGRAWETVMAGSRLAIPARVGMRLAGVNAASRAVEVADIAYTLAGGSSVYDSNVLQRCLRDAHVVTQHIQVAPKLRETLGKVLLGREADLRTL